MINNDIEKWRDRFKAYVMDLIHCGIYYSPQFEDIISKDGVNIEMEDTLEKYSVRILEYEKEVFYISIEYNKDHENLVKRYTYNIDPQYQDLLRNYVDELIKSIHITLDEFIKAYNKVYNSEKYILNKGE